MENPPDFGDSKAWIAWLQENASPEQIAKLKEAFPQSAAYQDLLRMPLAAKASSRDPDEWPRPLTVVWRRWAWTILHFEVSLKAAGRAVLRAPGKDYRVELQWVYDRKDKTHYPVSAHVIGDGYLPLGDIHLSDYGTALILHITERRLPGAFLRAPRSRPQAGMPLDPDFYKRLIASYDRLMAEGHPAPARELAERMDVNHGTLKSWLSRGRKYLQEGNE